MSSGSSSWSTRPSSNLVHSGDRPVASLAMGTLSTLASPVRAPVERARIGIAFGAIALMGVAAGAAGVLLPEQMAEYGVDKATIGLTFLAFSVGYIATATANGVLLHRLGVRRHLALGTLVALAAAIALT